MAPTRRCSCTMKTAHILLLLLGETDLTLISPMLWVSFLALLRTITPIPIRYICIGTTCALVSRAGSMSRVGKVISVVPVKF